MTEIELKTPWTYILNGIVKIKSISSLDFHFHEQIQDESVFYS